MPPTGSAMTYSGGMRRRLDLAMTLIGAPRSSSSTSRPPASIRAAVTRCGRSWNAWPTTAPPCFSPPNISTRRTSSPTGWRSSTADAGHRGQCAGAQAANFRRPHRGPVRRRRGATRGRRRVGDAGHRPGLAQFADPHRWQRRHLRRVLRDLEEAGVDVVDLAIHTPDLDDVFFALTGRDAHKRNRERNRRSTDEQHLRPTRFDHHAAARPAPPAALPGSPCFRS